MHTHSESNGGNDHEIIHSHELVLQLGLGSSIHSSMKESSFETLFAKLGGKLFSLLLQCDINDCGSLVLRQEIVQRGV